MTYEADNTGEWEIDEWRFDKPRIAVVDEAPFHPSSQHGRMLAIREFVHAYAMPERAEPELSRLRHELLDMRSRMAALEDLVYAILGSGSVPESQDEAVAWIRNHPEELGRHRGKHVAIHPKLGIVGAHADVEVLYAEVERKGLSRQVMFHTVPVR